MLESHTTLSKFEDLKAYLTSVSFKRFPDSWHYAGAARSYQKGVHPLTLNGLNLMVYQKSDQSFMICSRACLHMKADLTNGAFANGEIVCPMHAWKYDENGNCATAKANGLRTKCLTKYPVHNYKGHLFVFLGQKEKFFPFPYFNEQDLNLEVSATPIKFTIDLPWYMLGANGFDVNHFITVHQRQLTRPAEIEIKDRNRIQANLHFTNESNQLADRLLKRLLGNEINLVYEVIGGNIILARTIFKKKINYMMFCLQPLGENKNEVYLFPIKDKLSNPLINLLSKSLSFPVRKVFIKKFFADEINSIREIDFTPESLTPADETFMHYMKWLSGL